MTLDVLALEPYFGGSHRAVLDGWSAASRHCFTVLGLPPHHWKWRMRHAAIDFARQANDALAAREGRPWDVVWASSMLDLATWRGLAPTPIAGLPACLYFHENQLTYPTRDDEPRDLHFAMTHLTSGLAAQRVAFNSQFHREEFLKAAAQLVRRLPERRLVSAVDDIAQRSEVASPGIEPATPRPAARPPGPLRVVWAARWEHDKGPDDFFAALFAVIERGVEVRVSVLGESFRTAPAIFERARLVLGHRVDRWGGVADRSDYWRALASADVFVSTAHHEFFGIAAAEAAAAGCLPLVPDRLAYPELLADASPEARTEAFYDGSVDDL
ncbi:MAG: DUF3524 domain-containing protein, partial [Acidobacteriota bacterium]